MNRRIHLIILKPVVFLVFLTLFFSLARVTFAQAPSSFTQMQYKLNTNPDVPQNLNTYTQSVFIEMLSTVSCFITGTNPINPKAKCLGVDTKTGKLGYTNEAPGGLLIAMGHMIGSTYNIPVSTAGYTHYLASNFGFSKNSYAESDDSNGLKGGLGTGIGFVGLTPVMKIWTIFRNLTYLIFVFVFVLLGLGIMFRVNIDARTVMSIQNQIPKIIIGLILITFSYAIAGFLIDLMYISIYIIINLFDSQGLATLTNINTNPISAVGFFGDGIHSIAGPSASGVGGIIASLFSGKIGILLAGAAAGIMGAMIGSTLFGSVPFVGSIAGGLGGFAGGAVAGGVFSQQLIYGIATFIAYLIIVIAILSALFRVWFMLIKSYVYILVGVIFAPLWILAGIIPFGTGGFGPWIRSLIANLAAFPVVITLFLIGKSVINNMQSTNGNFIPPLIGNPGEGSVSAVGSIIGMGIILIMPEAVNITKSTLKAPDFKLTAAAGRAIGIGQSVIGKPIGGIRHELFGQDTLGNQKIGSRWLGGKVGRIGSILTGGGLEDRTKEGERKTPWVRNPINLFRRRTPTPVMSPEERRRREAIEAERLQREARAALDAEEATKNPPDNGSSTPT